MLSPFAAFLTTKDERHPFKGRKLISSYPALIVVPSNPIISIVNEERVWSSPACEEDTGTALLISESTA